MVEIIELVNTCLVGGIFITGLFWVYRSIKKEREEKDKETRVAS
jgi:cbb3-type cytochrome oxidase subunit 3